jgi:hypothetical protein
VARPGHDGSTGHGTGRTMPVPLALILERDRYRVLRKKALRRRKAPTGFRRGNGGTTVRDLRGRSVSRSTRRMYLKPDTSGDLKTWWQDGFKRWCEQRYRVAAGRIAKPGLLRRAAEALGLA